VPVGFEEELEMKKGGLMGVVHDKFWVYFW
jgi:hypothetical protein